MAEKDIFYINLESPTEVQRALLESTKHLLGSLKRYETFRKMREVKAEKLMELHHVMGELRLLNGRLKKVLPATGLRALDTKKEPEPEKPAKKTAKANTSPKPAPARKQNNLERIEDELKEIESRLKGLE